MTSRLILLLIVLALGGCSVAALPFRVAGDVIDVVPVVGGVASKPFKVTGDVID
jgi:hypothetical protein